MVQSTELDEIDTHPSDHPPHVSMVTVIPGCWVGGMQEGPASQTPDTVSHTCWWGRRIGVQACLRTDKKRWMPVLPDYKTVFSGLGEGHPSVLIRRTSKDEEAAGPSAIRPLEEPAVNQAVLIIH